MTNSENNYSRLHRKKRRNRGDRILNILNVAVVLAILITAYFILRGGDAEKVNGNLPEDAKMEDSSSEITDEKNDEESEKEQSDGKKEEDLEEVEGDQAESGVITYLAPEDDKIVEVTIIDPDWEPIGTTQTGEHVSLYDEKSVDWKEKQEAIAQATGLALEDTITWRIINGGSPQKSIGIVSSKDQAEMYRVYLEWVDQEGWKTIKMDVLKTINFDYKANS